MRQQAHDYNYENLVVPIEFNRLESATKFLTGTGSNAD